MASSSGISFLTLLLLALSILETNQATINTQDAQHDIVRRNASPNDIKILRLLLQLIEEDHADDKAEKKDLPTPVPTPTDEDEMDELTPAPTPNDEDEVGELEYREEEEFRECKNGRGGCSVTCGPGGATCKCSEGQCKAVCWCDGRDHDDPICDCRPPQS